MAMASSDPAVRLSAALAGAGYFGYRCGAGHGHDSSTFAGKNSSAVAAFAYMASVVSVALAGSRACTVLAVAGLVDQEANAGQCERMQGCQWSLSWPGAILCRCLLRFDGAATS